MTTVQVAVSSTVLVGFIGALIKIVYSNLDVRVSRLEKESATKEELNKVEQYLIRVEGKIDQLLVMRGGSGEK